MKPTDYFDRHPVFRFEDFAAAHTAGGRRSRHTTASVLKQHVAGGRLLHLRRGLYASVPRGFEAEAGRYPVNPYHLATQLAPDAVVAYHAALDFYGTIYSVWNRFHYLTQSRQSRFRFRNEEFVPIQSPVALRDLPDWGGGITEREHAGGLVRITTPERTFVDVLHSPEYCGGWEEVWRCLEMFEILDTESVVAYTRKLNSELTAARVGFFLEQHREILMVETHHLDALRELAPERPRYLDSRRESGKLIKNWNLIISEYVLNQAWDEFYQWQEL